MNYFETIRTEQKMSIKNFYVNQFYKTYFFYHDIDEFIIFPFFFV